MKHFDTFKADRVVCDESLSVQDNETSIPIAQPLPPGSYIDPVRTRVEIVVPQCDLHIDEVHDLFFMDLYLYIIKQITVVRPGKEDIRLEFSFVRDFTRLQVNACRPSEVPRELHRRLRCQLFDIEAIDSLRLHPDRQAFDQVLDVSIIMKIVFEDQIKLPAPGPKPPSPIVNPSLLEVLAGKIRNFITNPFLKKELLARVEQAKKLLLEGKVSEAVLIIESIATELQNQFNRSCSKRQSLNIILGDLQLAERQLVKLI